MILNIINNILSASLPSIATKLLVNGKPFNLIRGWI
jgi:hypothetical protein